MVLGRPAPIQSEFPATKAVLILQQQMSQSGAVRTGEPKSDVPGLGGRLDGR